MMALLIAAACALLARPLHRLLAATLPRRFGSLRPKLEWLTSGVMALTFYAATGLLDPLASSGSGMVMRTLTLGYGAFAILFFMHRRVYFGRRGVYEYRFGLPVALCAYKTVTDCAAGRDIVRAGLELHTGSGAIFGIPGIVSGAQIAEALYQLHRAGLSLPSEEDLKARLGFDYGLIRSAATLRF
ncbi:MAG: hypothetical protein AAFY81_04970 [Pseudomonadota bacterium]